MKNNEIRNIIHYIESLQKELIKKNYYDDDIKLIMTFLKERVNYLINDDIDELEFYLKNLKDNKEYLSLLIKENK